MPQWWQRLNSLQRFGIVVALVVAVPIFIAGAIAGLKDSAGGDGGKDSAGPTSTTAPVTQAPSTPPVSSAAPTPTFTYPGDPQCQIRYNDSGHGTTYWTVTTSVAGEVITHATDKSGHIYRHDQQLPAGHMTFLADVPFSQITDIGGNLDAADGQHFGCSVRPTF